jgi:hypothetical protein
MELDALQAGPRKRYCYVCGSDAHVAKDCPEGFDFQGQRKQARANRAGQSYTPALSIPLDSNYFIDKSDVNMNPDPEHMAEPAPSIGGKVITRSSPEQMTATVDNFRGSDGFQLDCVHGVENLTEVTRQDTMNPDAQLEMETKLEVRGKVLSPICPTTDTPSLDPPSALASMETGD